jgi:hypothetical protein
MDPKVRVMFLKCKFENNTTEYVRTICIAKPVLRSMRWPSNP